MKLGIIHGIDIKKIVENGNKMPNENNKEKGFENEIDLQRQYLVIRRNLLEI